MSKSEIEKIKAVLSDMNNCDETMLWMQNSKGEEYGAKIITMQEFRSLTKALAIAVEQIQSMSFLDKECRSPEQKALKQISEILERK